MTKKVYVLWASQGSWSDKSEWIVNIYSTLEGVINDPLNETCNLTPQVSRYDGLTYYVGETKPGEYTDPIYYSVQEFDVLDFLDVEVGNAKNHN